jgi:putative flippase GtrA
VAATSRTRERLSFLIVGGLSAAVDGGMFLLLSYLGVPPVLASALGFLSAFAVNYGGNRRLVFRSKGNSSLWRYVVLVIVNLGMSGALVAMGMAVGLHPIVAKAVSIVVVAVVNYFAMRMWVFRDRSPN